MAGDKSEKFSRRQAFPKESFRHPLPFSSLSALRFRRDLPYGNPPEELYY